MKPTKDQIKTLSRYIVDYKRYIKCDLCGKEFDTESQALRHFTKDELLEIAIVERMKSAFGVTGDGPLSGTGAPKGQTAEGGPPAITPAPKEASP